MRLGHAAEQHKILTFGRRGAAGHRVCFMRFVELAAGWCVLSAYPGHLNQTDSQAGEFRTEKGVV